MRKNELIEWLEGIDGDPEIMLASDGEANEIRHFGGVDQNLRLDTKHDEVFNPEDYLDDPDVQEDLITYPLVIVLYPEG